MPPEPIGIVRDDEGLVLRSERLEPGATHQAERAAEARGANRAGHPRRGERERAQQIAVAKVVEQTLGREPRRPLPGYIGTDGPLVIARERAELELAHALSRRPRERVGDRRHVRQRGFDLGGMLEAHTPRELAPPLPELDAAVRN